ncbi:sulfatase-like hydrolase/transferase [Flavicella sediminum]|uniref:sulfatase-like hydrolase/transferase n=1 Tax=Flavicella sediminum TaxID=2585141 RepID=UPI0011240E9A|nr:sulfatase-like hydrolase/transferase [Flavicella sediminum]
MKRNSQTPRFFFLLFLALLFSYCSSETMDAQEVIEDPEEEVEEETPTIHTQPNILLLIADDVSLDATPNYAPELNATKANMPTLEKLMQEGLVFDNLWSYSVCSPTRASILTGKHSISTGVYAPGNHISASEKSLQKYIDEQTNNAYAHAVFGKWHLSGNRDYAQPTDMGIGTFSGTLGGGLGDYWNYSLVVNSEITDVTDSYSTTKYTDLAIEWKNKQSKPWFLWVAYNAAHTPFHRPDDGLISNTSLAPYQEGRSDDLPYYLAMLEAMDHEMGRLIDSMTAEEKANTIVIYIGDNGTPKKVSQYGDTNKHRKESIYQGGINVPLVVSGNGVRVGRETDALVNTTDLFATIGELAGSTTTNIHESFSFKDLLYNDNAATKEFVYASVTPNNGQDKYAVRNDSYKLISVVGGSSEDEEMYNLKLDAYEETNILLRSLTNEETQARVSLQNEGKRIRGE